VGVEKISTPTDVFDPEQAQIGNAAPSCLIHEAIGKEDFHGKYSERF
jgi:hypothetical protein